MADVVPYVQTLLIRDDTVLLMRRQNTGVGDDWWAAPGGCIEAGEDFATAAIRETADEVGVDLKPAEVDLAIIVRLDSSHDGGARAVYTYHARAWTGDPVISEPDLCSALEWLPVSTLPPNTMASTRIAIQLLGPPPWP
ncbi:MAG: hydrolase [Nocardia sp.]|uniref:NUDIX domain-containing protein n=1 Tax=Nocardia sp. TaxID=1821 RepID=UPI00262709CC|nr:NUDIX domain-containing protein [Nocardia sp.]MCU1644032.1 hydrolase [Nocardia sp.]